MAAYDDPDDWAEEAPQGVLARAAACRDGRSPARHAHDRRRRLDVGAAPASREALGLRAPRPARRDAGVPARDARGRARDARGRGRRAGRPEARVYLLNTDGGNCGDPLGRAAIGALLRTRRLVTVAQISKEIGPATHNVAEYQGLIEGLKLAREYGIQRIRVYMDSELVVDQVNGVSAVRQAHLSELYKEARGLVDQFKSFRISWVPRELNAEADRLVNDALAAPA